MSVIDINTRTRYAGKGRPGASPLVGAEAGLVSGRNGTSDVGDGFAGQPITDRLGARLRSLNEAVREVGAGAAQGRPEGGAVSHVAAMLQKMRIASNEEHARADRQTPSQSDFNSWRDQIDRARSAVLGKCEDAMGRPAAPDLDLGPVVPVALNDREVRHPLWRTAGLVLFATTPTVGYPMRKDIALGALESDGDVGDMLGRQIVVNIQSVSFTCRISQEVVDAVRSGLLLSSLVGTAFQTAIRNYSLIANGDVVDAVFDGSVLNIRYVGDATKPLLVLAFSEVSPAVDLWSTEIDHGDGKGPALRIVAAPIDGVFTAFSRSCIAVDHRPFINDNAGGAAADGSATSDAPEVKDYAAASSESDKRSIIEQAAMAMIRNARRTQTPEQ